MIKNLIEEKYPLKIRSIYKSRSYYACDADKGLFKFKQTYLTPREIVFQYEIKKHLLNKNFTNTDSFLLSNEKLPYVRRGSALYVMTRRVDRDAADFSDEKVFKSVLKNLAVLHNLSRGARFSDYISYIEQKSNAEKDLESLEKIKKKIKKSGTYSDFDVFFLQNFSAVADAVKTSGELFKKYDLDGYIKKCSELKTICVCALKEEDILAGKGEIFFNNFERAGVGAPIFDLAIAAERCAKQKGKFSLAQIAEAYQESAEETIELELLKALYDYPKKYLKLYNEYYGKNRTWAPNRFYQKIDELKN
jgi:CotS family spore coat protein